MSILQNFDMFLIIAVVADFTTTEIIVLFRSHLNRNATFRNFHHLLNMADSKILSIVVLAYMKSLDCDLGI